MVCFGCWDLGLLGIVKRGGTSTEGSVTAGTAMGVGSTWSGGMFVVSIC